MKYSVTQFGKELDKSKYTWCEETKTFSTSENNLVLDFNGIDGVTFNTSSYCTFNTGSDCTFNTGSDCTFKTGSYCTFNTGSDCTFNTGYSCTFKTGSYCTFDTGSDCVVIRRDIYEIIEIEEGKKIKLNGYNEKGFTYIEEPKLIKIKTTDGQEMEITEEKAKELGFNIK